MGWLPHESTKQGAEHERWFAVRRPRAFLWRLKRWNSPLVPPATQSGDRTPPYHSLSDMRIIIFFLSFSQIFLDEELCSGVHAAPKPGPVSDPLCIIPSVMRPDRPRSPPRAAAGPGPCSAGRCPGAVRPSPAPCGCRRWRPASCRASRRCTADCAATS